MWLDGCHRLGEVIPAILKAWKRRSNGDLERVLEVWEGVVGSQVAQHATPIALRRAVLVVSVDSALWMAELSGFYRERILEELNSTLESLTIREVRFVCRGSSRRVSSEGDRHGEEARSV